MFLMKLPLPDRQPWNWYHHILFLAPLFSQPTNPICFYHFRRPALHWYTGLWGAANRSTSPQSNRSKPLRCGIDPNPWSQGLLSKAHNGAKKGKFITTCRPQSIAYPDQVYQFGWRISWKAKCPTITAKKADYQRSFILPTDVNPSYGRRILLSSR